MLSLYQSSEGVAVVTGVSSEALAETAVIITLSATTTLVRVVVGQLGLGDIVGSMVVAVLEGKTTDLGGAPVRALVVLHNQEVLRALHGVTSEGDDHTHMSLMTLA